MVAVVDISGNPDLQEYLTWAGFAPDTPIKKVSDRPWAQVFEIASPDGKTILKIAKSPQPHDLRATKLLSDRFAPDVPQVLHCDDSGERLLYRDIGGEFLTSRTMRKERSKVLQLYAKIQIAALGDAELQKVLPQPDPAEIWARAINLCGNAMRGDTQDDAPGNPFETIPPNRLSYMYEFLCEAEGLVAPSFRAMTALASTVNHRDLHYENIARRADGSLCLIDWDDACWGAPGWSLAKPLRGCASACSLLQMLDGLDRSPELDALSAYMDTLCEAPEFDREALKEGLVGAVLAGALSDVIAFAPFATVDPGVRQATSRSIREGLLDIARTLVLLCQVSDRPHRGLAFALSGLGLKECADRVLATSRRAHSSCLLHGRDPQDAPNVFPTVRAQGRQIDPRWMPDEDADYAAALFARHGALHIENALPRPLIQTCQRAYIHNKSRFMPGEGPWSGRKVGANRYMSVLPFDGPFADPALFAARSVLPILNRILGPDMIIGSMTSILAMGGATAQAWHRDNAPLFGAAPVQLDESFSVNVMIPLIDLKGAVGGTQIMKGTHLQNSGYEPSAPVQSAEVQLGSFFMIDSRLYHSGMANASDTARPIVSYVYQRRWFRDEDNFDGGATMDVSAQSLAGLTAEQRGLVDWAVR